MNPDQFNDQDDFAGYPRLVRGGRGVGRIGGGRCGLGSDTAGHLPEWGRSANTRGCLAWPHSRVWKTPTGQGILLGWPGWCSDCSIWWTHKWLFFGEKDWQQLQLVQAMVDRDGGPRIHAVPTSREADGLARSSRNERLSDASRQKARRCISPCKPPRRRKPSLHRREDDA